MKKINVWSKEDWDIFFDGIISGMVLIIVFVTALKVIAVW